MLCVCVCGCVQVFFMLPVSPGVSHKEQDLEQLLEVSRLTFICLQNKQTDEYNAIKRQEYSV